MMNDSTPNLDFGEIQRKAKPLAEKIAAILDTEDTDQVTAIVACMGAMGPLLFRLPRNTQAQLAIVLLGMVAASTGDIPPRGFPNA